MSRLRRATLAAGAVALVLAGSALAAYSTARLSVSYGPSNVTRIVASSGVNDDATARVSIVIPQGTVVTTSAAPGTKVGTVTAQVAALALGGALLPLSGDIVVATPETISAASQTACIGAATPAVVFVLVLQAADQTLNVPAYVVPVDATLAELGTSQLVICLPAPDIPVDKGGATFGAKFMSADMSFTNVFTALKSAVWVGLWTPWQAGVGLTNAAATVASPSLVGATAVTLRARRYRGRVKLSGKVTLDGDGFPTLVRLLGARGSGRLKLIKSVEVNEDGTYELTLPSGAKQTRFQARVEGFTESVGADQLGDFCESVFPFLTVPCSSLTVRITGSTTRTMSIR